MLGVSTEEGIGAKSAQEEHREIFKVVEDIWLSDQPALLVSLLLLNTVSSPLTRSIPHLPFQIPSMPSVSPLQQASSLLLTVHVLSQRLSGMSPLKISPHPPRRTGSLTRTWSSLLVKPKGGGRVQDCCLSKPKHESVDKKQ